jgi:hypothetical protein
MNQFKHLLTYAWWRKSILYRGISQWDGVGGFGSVDRD